MEIWDAYYKDGTLAGIDLIRGEAIPQGLYHMVCEVLVRHEDGDYLLMQRALNKEPHPGKFETSAGGSALKGEDRFACIKRELREETGICEENFTELGRFVFEDRQCIFYTFLCITSCDKNSITLQEGETISYRWLSEKEFMEFIRSDEGIPRQKLRFRNYFLEQGYIQE